MTNQQPTLVLMAGLPGSGKSTLALAIGRRLSWPVLDKDTVKSGLLGLGASEELSGRASYVLLEELARDLLVDQSLSVILDTAAFRHPEGKASIVEVANEIVKAAHGRLRIVLCLAGLDVRMRRLTQKSRMLSQPGPMDERSYNDITGNGVELFGHLPESTLRLNTEQDIETALETAVTYILGRVEQS